MSEPQATTASSKMQQVTLKPGEQSPILTPNLSAIAYRATALVEYNLHYEISDQNSKGRAITTQ